MKITLEEKLGFGGMIVGGTLIGIGYLENIPEMIKYGGLFFATNVIYLAGHTVTVTQTRNQEEE